MLTVLTLLIRRKNPVIADFTEAKQKDRMRKKSVAFCFLQEYTFRKKCPGAFLSCFVLCEWGVISVLVNTIPDT
jgi:hypothetical protein